MSESKKMVIKLDVHDDCDKMKALKAVSGVLGVESLSMDMKDQKLTVIGDVDPVEVAGKLKKWYPDILTVGPAKEPEKNEAEKKKEAEKKEAEKKKKEQEEREEAMRKWLACNRGYYNPYMDQQRYCIHPAEDDDPRGCVIC